LLAKAHQKVKRQRHDFQYKVSHELERRFDTIDHEDLQVADMVKNHHLAKSRLRTRAGVDSSPS
jgi:putative transposase